MTIAERIERLPLGGFHRRFIALVSLGNFFDLYDIFIVAYIGAALQQSGFLSLRQFTFFVAAGFLGMFVGTVVFGMGSDRMGRRSAFILLLLDLFGVYVCGCVCADGGLADCAKIFCGCRDWRGNRGDRHVCYGSGAELRARAVCGDYAGGGVLRGTGGGSALARCSCRRIFG